VRGRPLESKGGQTSPESACKFSGGLPSFALLQYKRGLPRQLSTGCLFFIILSIIGSLSSLSWSQNYNLVITMTTPEIAKVKKRDGSIVDFEQDKISKAIFKALTVTGEGDEKLAEKLAERVIKILNRRFSKREIPVVEQIQDIVEEVLMLEELTQTAKAYIIYREQRRRMRETETIYDEAVEIYDKYINEIDWQVKENANMAYSLQGLNNYGVSTLTKRYWLNKIYPQQIREAMASGDFHIHDLDFLGAYCCGWDLYDLLKRGFGGVPGKVESKPPKHLQAALGQMVNFFYTLQGEIAGAVAFSNFDTLLAPFIRYDKLEYKQVKQAMQEFLFNCAVPTRVGFQCLSEDTEILSPEGWKSYKEVQEGDVVYTFNLQTKQIEQKNVSFIFQKDYQGLMYNLKNRSQDQLISPNHRVVRQAFNAEHYVLESIEKILELKSPIAVPVRANNTNSDFFVEDEQLKLLAWTLAEGTIEKDGSHRVSIYQSQSNKENYQEIIGLLDYFDFDYSQREQVSLGTCMHIRLKPLSSRVIHGWIESTRKRMPDFIYKLSQRQARLFLDVFVKADGWIEKYRQRITTTDENLLHGLEALAVLAGYNFSVRQRMPQEGGIGKKLQHILTLTETQNDYIMQINKVDYRGVIWSVHTDNETVIAKRNGQVFITGNTPFSNITIDITPSPSYAKQPVIIGGELQKETYGEFAEEMKVFNKAFFEAMLEGDKNSRIFTFPIPTVSITKDFPWDEPYLEPMWLATAKYGLCYFANFLQSDMKPEDVRSMCCRLRLNNKELLKRGGGLFGANPLTGCYDDQTEILTNQGWKFFENLTKNDEVFTLTDKNFIELHKPNKLFEYDYNGEMYHFKTKSLDLLVTPNHKMVVDQAQSGVRKFVEAQDFNFNSHRIPKQSIWQGVERDFFVLPAVDIFKGNGPASHFSEEEIEIIRARRTEGDVYKSIADDFNCNAVTIFNICANLNYGQRSLTTYQTAPLSIKMDDWLAYFGFWLAEGSTDNENIAPSHGYRVSVCQVNEQKRKEIKEVLGRLPFSYAQDGISFVICNKQLWTYLRQFGKKYDKFIPQEIKALSKVQLKILFDWMVKGDGHVRKTTGQINYWTTSKKLADDLQEVILKLGFLGTMTIQEGGVSEIKGRKIYANKCYVLGVQQAQHYRLRKENVQKVFYQGKVYCCEVENHTVFVRRNGRVSWCGNSQGVVTINMSRLGYLSKTKKEFFERLGRVMDLAKESLEIKRKAIDDLMRKGLYPYSKHYLQDVEKMRGTHYGNHFSTIGILGMNECLLNFMGEDIGSTEGRKFTLEVMDFMREKIVKYQEETGNLYNLESTPAEGASFKLALKDREKYPEIITAGTNEVPYYTNSTQLPVNYTDDIFKAVELQDEIQCKYTGGVVLHLFIGEQLRDLAAMKSLIKKIFSNYKLPYITLTPTFSICPSHGYLSGEHWQCPKCIIEQPCEVYSRIVGYIRPVQQWHKGKTQEFKERKTFQVQ